MMFNQLFLCGLAVLFYVSNVYAEEAHYLYAGVALGSMTLDTGVAQKSTFNAYLVGGAQWHDYFASEIRVGASSGIDQPNFGTQVASPRAEWFVSVLAKPVYAVNETLRVYALLGFTVLKASYSNTLAVKYTKTNTDITYGVGAEFNFSETISFGLDWTRYSARKEKITLNTINFKGLDISALNGRIAYHF